MHKIKHSNRHKQNSTYRKKYKELFGAPAVLNATDPELMTILQRFIFGEIFYIRKSG